MKLSMLPNETGLVIAAVDIDNEVNIRWLYENGDAESHPDNTNTYYVWKTQGYHAWIIHVQSCAWFDPTGHFKIELTTDNPVEAVKVAVAAAAVAAAA